MAEGPPLNLLRELADSLKTDLPSVRAVVQVEASGSPFLPTPSRTPNGDDVSGYPVVAFEGHVFWRELTHLKIPALRPSAILAARSDIDDILYPSLTARYQKPPVEEGVQLRKAMDIHMEAAKRSASWGMFQIMGFNHLDCGFESVLGFAEDQWTIEGQVRSFFKFLGANPRILAALRGHDWAMFARLYNGPGYKRNEYDRKMATWHLKFGGRP